MVDERCSDCSGPLDQNRATCNLCGQEFHLALRIDVPARECGDAWIDDEVQALVFGCNVCLGRGAPAEPRKRYARREGRRASAVARSRKRTPRLES
jgi:hypothetical protein